jgi:hypothetical protein
MDKEQELRRLRQRIKDLESEELKRERKAIKFKLQEEYPPAVPYLEDDDQC